MQLTQWLLNLLNNKKAYYTFVAFTILSTCALFYINLRITTNDEAMYINYAKGLHVGRYSYWYFLKDYVPDTFRNPGFPFFIYILSFITTSPAFIKIVQLILFFLALYLMMKLLNRYDKQYILKNIFLLFLNANFVILAYPGYVFPETLMILLITLIVYIEIIYKEETWKKVLVLCLLYAISFQVRPIVLFLPFFRFFYFLVYAKKTTFLKNVTFIFLFILSLMPYAAWNYKHHHQLKITPLEGGGGVMYLGYWSPKMVGYREDKYWLNVTPKDAFINFSDETDRDKNVEMFLQEWDSIEQLCKPYFTMKDSIHLSKMKENRALFVTLNGKYTTEREKILKKLAFKHYLEDWQYTLKLKTYSFFRLWYTGIPEKALTKFSLSYSMPLILAFLGAFISLCLFLVYFLYCLIKRRDILVDLAFPLLLCLYFVTLHLPFGIQSRYTIPVRILYLFAISIMIFKIHFNKQEKS